MTLKTIAWALVAFMAWVLPLLYMLTTDNERVFPFQFLAEKPDLLDKALLISGLLTLFTLTYQSAFIQRWDVQHPILQWLLLIPAYTLLLSIIVIVFGGARLLFTMPWWGWIIGPPLFISSVLLWRNIARFHPHFHGCF